MIRLRTSPEERKRKRWERYWRRKHHGKESLHTCPLCGDRLIWTSPYYITCFRGHLRLIFAEWPRYGRLEVVDEVS